MISAPPLALKPSTLPAHRWRDIARFYAVADDTVKVFLECHPSLADILIEMRPQLAQYFGDTPFSVEIRPGNAIDGDSLMVNVQTEVSADIALGQLERFHDDYWIDRVFQLPRADSQIYVSLDFV